MWAVLRRNPVALALAVLLHLGLAIFLIFEFDWGDKVKPIGSEVQVVQAELVDGQALEAAQRRKEAEAAAAKQAELEKRRAEEKAKLAELERQRKAREAKQAREKAEAEKRAAAEKARLAEVKRKEEAKKRKQAEEQQRQAELAAKREAEEKARKAAEAAEAAKAEEERKARVAREKAEAERKRKAAAEAKARADREAREAELAAKIAAEQEASELARVMGLIQAKVNSNWLRPPGTEGLQCTVRVRLGASGSVLLVSVVESSGNVAFDRSVEAAVRKADPLPMPQSSRLVALFRDLTFIFDPSS